jgi:hypothetical protein
MIQFMIMEHRAGDDWPPPRRGNPRSPARQQRSPPGRRSGRHVHGYCHSVNNGRSPAEAAVFPVADLDDRQFLR